MCFTERPKATLRSPPAPARMEKAGKRAPPMEIETNAIGRAKLEKTHQHCRSIYGFVTEK